MKGASLWLSQDRGLQMAIVKNADFLKQSNSYLNILVNHFIVTMHYKYNKKPTADLAQCTITLSEKSEGGGCFNLIIVVKAQKVLAQLGLKTDNDHLKVSITLLN